MVDTQGLVLEARVHGAQIQDREGIKLLLDIAVRDRLPGRLSHLWLDASYTGEDKGAATFSPVGIRRHDSGGSVSLRADLPGRRRGQRRLRSVIPLARAASVATTAPANAAAYLSNQVGRNLSTGVARIGRVTKPGLNANSLRRICGVSILVHERDAKGRVK